MRTVVVVALAAAVLGGCQTGKGVPIAAPDGGFSWTPPPSVPSDITVTDEPSREQIVWSSGEGDHAELYRSNPNGSGLKRMTANTRGDYEPSWTRDMNGFAFVCSTSRKSICRANADGTGQKELFSIGLFSSDPNLTYVSEPKLSPNNRVLAFEGTALQGRSDIYAYSVDTKAMQNVTSTPNVSEWDAEWDIGAGTDVGLFWIADGRLVWLPPGATDWNYLTDANEYVNSVDITRDGLRLVLEVGASRGATTDLVVMDIDGTNRSTITQTATLPDLHPSWSYDGTKIVYSRKDQPSDQDTEIYTINPDGTGVQRITFNNVNDSNPDWARPPVVVSIGDVSAPEGNSGTTIFSFPVTLSVPETSSLSVEYATRIISATANADYDIVSGTLTFAPGETEKTINVEVEGDLVVEPYETFEIVLSNPEIGLSIGKATGRGTIENDDRAATPTPTATVTPTPTGTPPPASGPTQIAYSSGSGAAYDIWMMGPDGESKRNLTSTPDSEGSPDISPDGTSVLFHRGGSSGPPAIYQVPATGGQASRVNGDPSAANLSPSWAPSGTGMVWVVNSPDGVDLFTANPITGTPQRLTNDAAIEGYPDWGRLSDGTEAVAFHVQPQDPHDPAGVWQLRLMELPGGSVRDLGEGRHPEISPDGTKLVFASKRSGGDNEIYVLDLTQPGATPVALTTNSVEDITPSWSPDGSMIAYATHPNGGTAEIFTMNADGTNKQNVSNNPNVDDWEPSWGRAPVGAADVVQATGTTKLALLPSSSVLFLAGAGLLALTGQRRRTASGPRRTSTTMSR